MHRHIKDTREKLLALARQSSLSAGGVEPLQGSFSGSHRPRVDSLRSPTLSYHLQPLRGTASSLDEPSGRRLIADLFLLRLRLCCAL